MSMGSIVLWMIGLAPVGELDAEAGRGEAGADAEDNVRVLDVLRTAAGIATPPEPSDSGWFSGKALLPSRLVVTGISSSSASSELVPGLGVVHALARVEHGALGL